jgi:hypothetical protein
MKARIPGGGKVLEHAVEARPAGDHVEADLARWQTGADGWWGDPGESTAELFARMEQLAGYKAEILPFLRPRLLQPGVITGQGGPSAYLVQLSRSLYEETQVFPVGLGPVEAIGVRLLGRVIGLEVACDEARTLAQQGDLIAPYAQALAVYLVRQASGGGDPTKVLPLATVALAMAEGQQPGTDTTLSGWTSWRCAADAYVEIAGSVLCRQADVGLYDRTREVAASVVDWGAERGSGERSQSLALLGNFLLRPFTADAGFLREDDPWRQVQKPMQPGNPRSTYALREAASTLDDAIAAGECQVDTRTWLDYVTAHSMVAKFDPDTAQHRSHVDSAVSAARLALDLVADGPPGAREYIEGILRVQLAEQAHQ